MKLFPRIVAASTLITTLLLALVVGCSDSPSLLDPETGGGDTPTSFGEIVSMTDGVSQSSGTTIYSTSVDSTGGTLDGPDADFSVTEGALSSTTTITMTVDDAVPDEVVMGPSGQQFSKTCLLLMDKPDGYSSSATYTISWWDAANSTWVDLEAGDLGPVVVASIDHFSKYRIEEL